MENKNIQKPITVAQSELANKIIENINKSNLHPVLLMPVIEEIYTLTKNTLKETRKKEQDDYEKAISENNKNDESK